MAKTQNSQPPHSQNSDFRSLVNKEDVAHFLEKSDQTAWGMVAANWLIIVAAFLLPILWLNPVTLLTSVILLANRQLGLGILMHDCSHSALFKTRHLNQSIGKWLCAAPVLADLDGYRRYHLKHHNEAGTTNDPDYPNYKNFPVTQGSFTRKVLRDFSGLTGIKTIYAVMLMHAGIIEYDMSYQKSEKDPLSTKAALKNLATALFPSMVIHATMIALLIAIDAGPYYLLWWVAFLTCNMFFSRIRNSAEHANVPNLLDKDPRKHARTTYACWWEKLTFAPNHVNYHLEHHWLPTVPPYHLKEFHQYLTQKGYLENGEVLNSYIDVMRKMMGMPVQNH